MMYIIYYVGLSHEGHRKHDMNRLNTDHSQVNRLLDQILSGSVIVYFVDASNRRVYI